MITPDGSLVAVVANQIVQARHRLDPRQQKVICWAIAQIARDDADLVTHTLSVTEFAKLIGSESGSLFKEMEAVTSSLLQEVLHIRINEGDRQRVKFQWVSECVYRDGEGTVTIKFHERLKPYLLELRSRFTQLKLDKFFTFRSTYTIRFFERIEMQRGLNRMTWTMTLNELREWLGLDQDGYKAFSAFKAYILNRAQAELDTRSDWSFSFQTTKVGRKISGVEFTLRPARSPKIDPVRDRWKSASKELQIKVLQYAHTLDGWGALSDSEIQKDPRFWNNLGMFFDAVEHGQKQLDLN